MTLLKQINYQLPWVIMMVLITIESGISGSEFNITLAAGVDKIIHFFIFGVLGWLMTRGLSNAPGKFIPKYFIWLVILLALFFGVSDELHQTQTPGRTPDILDWVADALGIIFFMWLYLKRNNTKVEGQIP